MARPKLEQPNYSLIRRGSKYHVSWWEDGKSRSVSTGQEDERQAKAWLAQFIAGRGTPEPPPTPTITAILEAYLADRKSVVVPAGYATLANCSNALRRHLGDLQPHHLTKERIRFYRRQRAVEGYEVGREGERRRKPVQDGTILRELVTLRAALKFAKAEKWIGEVPYIEVPSQPPPRDRWLTREEAQRLLENAEAPHVRVFLTTALYTAARSTAVLELTWDKVDFKAGRIDLGAGTGNKKRAIVPIAEPLRPILEEARQMATCPYVVEHGGKPVASVKKGVQAAARRAGLAGVTPGVLRHTAATWMAIAGISIEEIARVLGHTSSRITWRVYAKYQPDYLKGAITALGGKGVSSSIAEVTG